MSGGNVLATITDRRILLNGVLEADVVTATDYYPFGMNLPSRNFSSQSSEYRYGFNGKENSPEITNGAVSFEARIYDSRIGRFFNTDPREREYAWQCTYVYFKNCPTSVLDVLGMGGDESDRKNSTPITDVDPNGKALQLPSRAKIVSRLNGNEKISGTNIKIKTKVVGAVNRFEIDGKMFSAKFNAKTGEFANYSFENDGGANPYDFDDYSALEYFYVKLGAGSYKPWGGASFQYNFLHGEYKSDFKRSGIDWGIKASVVNANFNSYLGIPDYNAFFEGEGSILSTGAGLQAKTSLFNNKETKIGAFIEAGAGAYMFKGELNGGVTLGGFKLGGTIGGSAMSAHAGIKAGAYYDKKDRKLKVNFSENFGLGIGLKLGFNLEIPVAKINWRMFYFW